MNLVDSKCWQNLEPGNPQIGTLRMTQLVT